MAEQNDTIQEYDEDVAIKYVLEHLPKETAAKYDEDDILSVIDSIFDFYEEKGFFDVDAAEGDDAFDEKELCDFIIKALKKDKYNRIDFQDVGNIVRLEMEYEDSIAGF